MIYSITQKSLTHFKRLKYVRVFKYFTLLISFQNGDWKRAVSNLIYGRRNNKDKKTYILPKLKMIDELHFDLLGYINKCNYRLSSYPTISSSTDNNQMSYCFKFCI